MKLLVTPIGCYQVSNKNFLFRKGVTVDTAQFEELIGLEDDFKTS